MNNFFMIILFYFTFFFGRFSVFSVSLEKLEYSYFEGNGKLVR